MRPHCGCISLLRRSAEALRDPYGVTNNGAFRKLL